ncbi:hypothetical protein [Leuconostoc citreum]
MLSEKDVYLVRFAVQDLNDISKMAIKLSDMPLCEPLPRDQWDGNYPEYAPEFEDDPRYTAIVYNLKGTDQLPDELLSVKDKKLCDLLTNIYISLYEYVAMTSAEYVSNYGSAEEEEALASLSSAAKSAANSLKREYSLAF